MSEAKTLHRIFGSIDLRAYSMLLALAVLWAVFQFATDGIFFSPINLSNLMSQTAVTGILAVGMLLVIISGNIDLSVGSVLGVAGAVSALLIAKLGYGLETAVAGALAVGLIIGLLQGSLVSYLRIPAFIVTLGGLLAWRGALKWMTNSETVQVFDSNFKMIGNQFIDPRVGWILTVALIVVLTIVFFRRAKLRGETDHVVLIEIAKVSALVVASVVFVYKMNSYAGIPISVTVMFIVGAAASFVINQTVFGRRLYAIGGNVEAARLSGVDDRLTVLKAYALLGILVGVASLISTARLGSATVDAGTLKELEAVAACVIGGASLAGGRGTVFGALLGALIMSSLDNGMGLLGVGSFKQEIVKGVILVSAVGFDVTWSRNRNR